MVDLFSVSTLGLEKLLELRPPAGGGVVGNGMVLLGCGLSGNLGWVGQAVCCPCPAPLTIHIYPPPSPGQLQEVMQAPWIQQPTLGT